VAVDISSEGVRIGWRGTGGRGKDIHSADQTVSDVISELLFNYDIIVERM